MISYGFEGAGFDVENLPHSISLHQSHSALVFDETGAGKQGDALVTDSPGRTLVIKTADCAPILLWGENKGGRPVIAACHAGWRGALAGIIENTIEMMVQKDSRLNSIRAQIGPCIHSHSYEIGPEFYDFFTKKDPNFEPFFKAEQGRMYFDLPQFCAAKLHYCGVPKIEMSPINTFEEPQYHSFRREGAGAGRNYSWIRIEA